MLYCLLCQGCVCTELYDTGLVAYILGGCTSESDFALMHWHEMLKEKGLIQNRSSGMDCGKQDAGILSLSVNGALGDGDLGGVVCILSMRMYAF